jgi:hypothetical protein
MERFCLLASWVDIWFSLRANQHRLWAFRFTILIILKKISVVYPAIKTVQHTPRFDGTNVQRRPKWDLEIQNLEKSNCADLKPQILNHTNLNKYIGRNIQGATVGSIGLRLLFRISKKVKIRKSVTLSR